MTKTAAAHPLEQIRNAERNAPVNIGDRVGNVTIVARHHFSRWPNRDTIVWEMPDGVRSAGLVVRHG